MKERLTPREVQCVRLAGEGLSDKEIRRLLGMGSERTVQGHLARAYVKLGAHDRRTAARLLGNDYPELPIPISQPAAAALPEPVSGADKGLEDDRPSETFYGRYAGLGRWRKPPRWLGGRTLLILGLAVLIVTALGGSMTLLRVVFEMFEIVQR